MDQGFIFIRSDIGLKLGDESLAFGRADGGFQVHFQCRPFLPGKVWETK